MHSTGPIYPHCPVVTRVVRIGGLGKDELLAALVQSGIAMNEAAQTLLAHAGFTTSNTESAVETIEIAVANLGLAEGAMLSGIFARASQLDLCLCPLELAPYLRLQCLDQPEGHVGQPPSQHRAPPGSLTIASAAVSNDEAIPRGFYLRRINGVLWLRGYRCGPDHVWSPSDRFVFAVRPNAPHDRP